jgi:hypothetical protein
MASIVSLSRVVRATVVFTVVALAVSVAVCSLVLRIARGRERNRRGPWRPRPYGSEPHAWARP